MDVRMSPVERALYEAAVRSATVYLEFGSGGSTCLARKLMHGLIVSVDGSQEWLDKVRSEVEDAERLELHLADIGPTKEWGYPIDNAEKELFPVYYRTVWQKISAPSIDTVLVDGRFRVACFAETILRVSPTTRILFHDYRSRPQYHVAEQIGLPIAEAEDLTIFLPRPGAARDAVDILNGHAFEPS